MSQEKKTYHERFADQVIEQIGNGTAPWMKPWTPDLSHMPHNPSSGTVYKGGNRVFLAMQGYADPRWKTFNQVKKDDQRVKKGEKGTPVVYWQWEKEEPRTDDAGNPVLDASGNPQKVAVKLEKPLLRASYVFNGSQIEGIEPWEGSKKEYAWNPVEKAESILTSASVPIIHDQRDRAYYAINADEIHLPAKENFPDAPSYYDTALHELGHSTRHPTRLHRESGPFGSEAYAREELRAEIASWMVSVELGIPHDTKNHASYVDNWQKVLKDDPFEIVRACRDAEKIMEYLMERERTLALETEKQRDTPVQARMVSKEIPYSPENDNYRRLGNYIADASHDGENSVLTWQAGCMKEDYQEALTEIVDTQALNTTTNKTKTYHLVVSIQSEDESRLTPENFVEIEKSFAQTLGLEEHQRLCGVHKNTHNVHMHIAYNLVHRKELTLSEPPRDFSKRETLCRELEQKYNLTADKDVPLDRVPAVAGNKKDARTYLNVPYEEREFAKQGGAKWDWKASAWYAPVGSDLTPLQKWIPEEEKKRAPLEPHTEFAKFIEEAGGELKGELPILDGKIHRISAAGSRTSTKSFAYCGYSDGIPNGWVQNYQTGEQSKWVATGHVITEKEKIFLASQAKARREQQEKERIAQQARAAEECRNLFEARPPAHSDHPYLVKKGILPDGLKASRDGSALLAPLINTNGEIRSLQYIHSDGSKRFHPEAEKSGNFLLLGSSLPQDEKNLSSSEIILCEGVATGQTIREAVGKSVAVCFDSGNLEKVALNLREKFPNAAITICADNDHKSDMNVGISKAQKAAEKVQGKVIVPFLTEVEKTQGLTDFNDIKTSRGIAEVTKQINRGLQLNKNMERGMSL